MARMRDAELLISEGQPIFCNASRHSVDTEGVNEDKRPQEWLVSLWHHSLRESWARGNISTKIRICQPTTWEMAGEEVSKWAENLHLGWWVLAFLGCMAGVVILRTGKGRAWGRSVILGGALVIETILSFPRWHAQPRVIPEHNSSSGLWQCLGKDWGKHPLSNPQCIGLSPDKRWLNVWHCTNFYWFYFYSNGCWPQAITQETRWSSKVP